MFKNIRMIYSKDTYGLLKRYVSFVQIIRNVFYGRGNHIYFLPQISSPSEDFPFSCHSCNGRVTHWQSPELQWQQTCNVLPLLPPKKCVFFAPIPTSMKHSIPSLTNRPLCLWQVLQEIYRFLPPYSNWLSMDWKTLLQGCKRFCEMPENTRRAAPSGAASPRKMVT